MLPNQFGSLKKFGNVFSACAVFFGLSIIIREFRNYHFPSGVGWLDPWVTVGYAQKFPEKSFTWHYYKESRVLTILWNKLTLFEVGSNFVYICTVGIFALLVFLLLHKTPVGKVGAFFLAALLACNDKLWGDWAGGGDYFNTLGNVIVVLAFLLYTKITTSDQNSRLYIRLFGSAVLVLILEVPSGVIISFIFLLAIYLNIFFNSSNSKKIFFTKPEFRFLNANIAIGAVFLIIAESLVLLLLNQDLNRLLAGPKFLVDSILNSEVQGNWWKPIDFNNIVKYPIQQLFVSLTILNLALHIRSRGKNEHENKYFQQSFLFTSILLIVLQQFGKTIALSTSYFTTPIILLGLLVLVKSLILINRIWNLVIAFAFFVILDHFFILNTKAFWGLLTFTFFVIIIRDRMTFELGKNLACVLRLFLVLLLILPTLNFTNENMFVSKNFKECESVRSSQKKDLVYTANLLDSFGKRGTLVLSAEDDIFLLKGKSKCPEFNEVKISNYLMSLSQMGFPSAAIYGSIKGYTGGDYHFESLGRVKSRQLLPIGCYISIKSHPDSNSLRINILGNSLFAVKVCDG